MRAFRKLRDFAFRVRHGFRGVPFRIGDFTIRLDESLRRWNVQSESDVQRVLIERLQPGDCMLDIGANFGLHALLAAAIVGPRGAVHAFEPLARNLQMLRHNVRLNGVGDRICVVPSAVSNSVEKELVFYSGKEDIAVTASLKPADANCVVQRVPNLRLDDYRGLDGLKSRLIKIDVEGAELDVLRGAENILRAQKPILVIEVHAFAFPAFGTSLAEFRKYLVDLDYRETVLAGGTIRDGLHYQSLFEPCTPPR